MALLRNLQRSNYRLLGLVGQGQFGQVYCAVHRRTGRLVALKNLNRDRLTTHRFLRELRFLLSLEHPNIANCHALEQSATGRQLVLDYCEGGTLRQLMEQTAPLPLAEILTLITEVLTALDHAHTQTIVHCDIKPENILLFVRPGGWQVKISDFGIARLSQELRGQDQTGATGSPAYMAPERFYHQHSASSDLYAVGVILYELLLGERPFSGTPSQLMVAHLNQTPPIPTTLPDSLQGVIRTALQKLVGRRYRSAAAMQETLSTMRAQLSAAELRTPYPIVYDDEAPLSFVSQGEIALNSPVHSLVAESAPSGATEGYLLLGDRSTDVKGWLLSSADGGKLPQGHPYIWTLPDRPQAIFSAAEGAIAATDRTLYRLPVDPLNASVQRLWSPVGKIQPLVTFPEAVTVVVSPRRRWALGYSPTAGGRLWWAPLSFGKTAASAVPEPRSLPLPAMPSPPVQLLALDEGHILLAAIAGHQTHLHVITRRGVSLGHLTLNATVQSLTLTHTPRRILAQEIGPSPALLIIDLLPFRVMRCRLDVATPWLGEMAIGYVACSDQGHLRFVNPNGQLVGRVDGLPAPTAMAFQAPYHLWLATHQAAPTLQVIDISTLGLDIIF